MNRDDAIEFLESNVLLIGSPFTKSGLYWAKVTGGDGVYSLEAAGGSGVGNFRIY
ncbi:MAG: hypothetical protein N2C14_05855 [Planctomycetales bacterium]